MTRLFYFRKLINSQGVIQVVKMLVLFETPAGYAIFKLLDEKKFQAQQSDNLYEDFKTIDAAKGMVKLQCFSKFEVGLFYNSSFIYLLCFLV